MQYKVQLFGRKLTINSSSRFPKRAVTPMFIVPKSLSDSISQGLIFKMFPKAYPRSPKMALLGVTKLYQLYRASRS